MALGCSVDAMTMPVRWLPASVPGSPIDDGGRRNHGAQIPARMTPRACLSARRVVAMAAKQPFVIVGKGRVGSALMKMGPGTDVMVGRSDPIPTSPAGPIVVCTRNDTLDDVVNRTPESRRKDLLFIQNGMLQPWLDAKGLGSNTQALIYFAVAKMGDAPTDGKTAMNPEGLTAVTGPHAESFAERLRSGGLSCRVLGAGEPCALPLHKTFPTCVYFLDLVSCPAVLSYAAMRIGSASRGTAGAACECSIASC